MYGCARAITGTPRWRARDGGNGLALAAAAFYTAEALLLEDTRRRTVLPLFRHAAAEEAIEGDLGAQLHDIEREAGVRRQL